MALAPALAFALALAAADPAPAEAPAAASSADTAQPAAVKPEEVKPEDMVPAGAPSDDYGLVSWCKGALRGQVELDPIVTKDMDTIEGKVKAAERHKGDQEIARIRRKQMADWTRALKAAEDAAPGNLAARGAEEQTKGYNMWSPTRNKAPIWRMLDWGNWEAPPRCDIAAKRLYDGSSLFAEALKPDARGVEGASTEPAPAADATADPKADAPAAPASDAAAPAPDASAVSAPPAPAPDAAALTGGDAALRGPQ